MDVEIPVAQKLGTTKGTTNWGIFSIPSIDTFLGVNHFEPYPGEQKNIE